MSDLKNQSGGGCNGREIGDVATTSFLAYIILLLLFDGNGRISTMAVAAATITASGPSAFLCLRSHGGNALGFGGCNNGCGRNNGCGC